MDADKIYLETLKEIRDKLNELINEAEGVPKSQVNKSFQERISELMLKKQVEHLKIHDEL